MVEVLVSRAFGSIEGFTQMVNLPIVASDTVRGMALMKRFLDQVGIREYLNKLDLPELGSNRGYPSVEIIESFWLNIWTGASRYVIGCVKMRCPWEIYRPKP